MNDRFQTKYILVILVVGITISSLILRSPMKIGDHIFEKLSSTWPMFRGDIYRTGNFDGLQIDEFPILMDYDKSCKDCLIFKIYGNIMENESKITANFSIGRKMSSIAKKVPLNLSRSKIEDEIVTIQVIRYQISDKNILKPEKWGNYIMDFQNGSGTRELYFHEGEYFSVSLDFLNFIEESGFQEKDNFILSDNGFDFWIFDGRIENNLDKKYLLGKPDEDYLDEDSISLSRSSSRLQMLTIGSQANEKNKQDFFSDDNVFDPSPIFIDLNSDGNDEIITYFKNTVYNNTQKTRTWEDMILAIEYKENPTLMESLEFGNVPYIMSWRFILSDEVHTSFSAGDISLDGSPEIIFGSDDGNLYVLDNNGNLRWKFDSRGKIRSTPAIGDLDFDNKYEIIFGSDDGNLYVLDNKGNLKWKFETESIIRSSPLFFLENSSSIITFGSDDGNLYLLDNRGNLRCKYETSGKIRSSPLYYNGSIIFGSDDGNIYILNTECNLIKKYRTNDMVRSSPSLFNGEFTIGSKDGNIYYFDYNQITKRMLNASIISIPVVLGSKSLVSTIEGDIYLINSRSDELLLDLENVNNFSCSPALGKVEEGIVFSCFFIKESADTKYSGFFIHTI